MLPNGSASMGRAMRDLSKQVATVMACRQIIAKAVFLPVESI
jgi:hypothetical protein